MLMNPFSVTVETMENTKCQQEVFLEALGCKTQYFLNMYTVELHYEQQCKVNIVDRMNNRKCIMFIANA